MRQQSNKLKNDARLAHGFFGRSGGVSTGIYASLNCGAGSQDDPAHVAENKRRVTEKLGAQTLLTLAQIHSVKVVTVSEPFTTPPEADAMVTNRQGIALGILTADCAPVLFADADAGVIGAAHAGWKGAIGGVLENTVAAMEALGASRTEISVVIGPTIAQASYEVGEAFRQPFIAQDESNARFFTEAHYFDLPGYIAHRLTQMRLASVEDLAIDTYANEAEYFSYRRKTHRSDPDYGRQLSAMMLKGQ